MAKPKKIVGLNPKQSFHENARILIPQRVAEVYRWEQFIHDPEKRDELHNMRISVKRLRYTMEFFSVNYDTPKKYEASKYVEWTSFIDTIIELQDLLGDVHDNDVVLETLTKYKKAEYKKAEYKNNQHSTDMIGIETLITQTREKRTADYESFLKRWQQLSTTNFKQKLLDIIAS